jgi:predicted dehydrogenase
LAEKLKAGIIGVGILGGQHADFYHHSQDAQLAGLADPRAEVGEAKAAETGATAYRSYEEMFKAESLDVVSVATPDPLHKEPFMAAIKAGVPNIICEKPLATSVPEAEEMMDAAHKAGTRVFVNFSTRGLSVDRATRYLYQQGMIGDVVYGEVLLDDNITVPTQMWGNRTKEWAGGSSTAHFLVSHLVDLLRWYFAPAEATNVYAISQEKVLGYTPDLYDSFISFSNGARFRVKAEWIRRMDELVEVTLGFTGTEGSIAYNRSPSFGVKQGWRANVMDDLSPQKMLDLQEAMASNFGVKANVLLHRPSPVLGKLEAGAAELKNAFEIWEIDLDFDNTLAAFVRAIAEDSLEPSNYRESGPLPTGGDGLIQTRIVAGLIESAETGHEVHL